jgi:hypothetical protein
LIGKPIEEMAIMPQEYELKRVVDLFEEAEKANAQGEKECHEHGFILLQTQDWIDRAEQERDEYAEKINPHSSGFSGAEAQAHIDSHLR